MDANIGALIVVVISILLAVLIGAAVGVSSKTSTDAKSKVENHYHGVLVEPQDTWAPPIGQGPTEEAIRELVEAIRLSVEYVGTDVLKPLPGWTWYDTLSKYDPALAAHFVEWDLEHGPQTRNRTTAISNKHETFDENTLNKVYDGIKAAGMTENQARDIVTYLQNRGILFRENLPE